MLNPESKGRLVKKTLEVNETDWRAAKMLAVREGLKLSDFFSKMVKHYAKSVEAQAKDNPSAYPLPETNGGFVEQVHLMLPDWAQWIGR